MKIIDGKKIAQDIKNEISQEIKELQSLKGTGSTPGLAIIIVGENKASQVYVRSKIRACKEVGIKDYNYILPEETTEEQILDIIDKLNKDKNINGILVQLPLPKTLNESKIIDKISIDKDVDGFKPENLGKLMLGDKNAFISCTPQGIMELLKRYKIDVKGKDVTIVGRSNIVGKPMAALIINASGTVTICNSHTQDLASKCKNADILIVAIGKAKFITKDHVKEGAVVIDVGINRTEEGLAGDVDLEDVKDKVSFITPVPGGVGPMTVAMLLKNTLEAFKKTIDLN